MRLAGLTDRLRSSGLDVAVAGALLFTAVSAVAVAALWRERLLTLEQARDDAAMLAAVMEESTARTFDSVDMALAGMAEQIGATRPPKHDAATRERMRERLAQLPTVRAFFVIGTDGFVQHDTDHPRTPNVSLADRPYFQAYLREPGLRRHLSQALQSRSGTGWFVAASRRIDGPDGGFAGIVVAAVQLDSVSRLYRKLQLGEGRQMALFQRDGQLLARFPNDTEIGRSYAGMPVFARLLSQAPSGVFDTTGPPYSDVPRVVSYRALDSQPLVVVMSVSHASALAAWQRAASGVAVALLLLAMLIAAGALVYSQRRMHQRRASELGLADERKTQFLATLSHELRNVLAPIQNGLAVMERADPQSPQARRAWQIVLGQVGQMRRLLDDLLDVARVSSGKVQLHRERLDLRDVVAEAAAAAQGAMDAAGHQLSVDAPPEPVPVRADRARLLQVLANLLGNAAKYTPAGGAIGLALRVEGSRAMLEVRDNGVGIPAAELPKVFGMFEQVEQHRARSQGGLGIGLALVARLAALHGGEVTAHSSGDGTGSTFTVALPLDADTDAAAGAAAASG